MTTQSQQLLREALDLPPIERAELVEQILASFDFPARKEIDNLWAKEVEGRIDAYERGDIKAVPIKRIFDKIDNDQST